MDQESGYLITPNYQHNIPQQQNLSSHSSIPHTNITKHSNPSHQQYNYQNRLPLDFPQDPSTTSSSHDKINNNTNSSSFQNSRNNYQIVMSNSISQNNNPYSSMNGSNSAMKVRTIAEGSPSIPRYSTFFADPKDNEKIPSASRTGQHNATGFIEPETQMPILRANNNFSNLPQWNPSKYNMRTMTEAPEDRYSPSPYSAPNQKRDFMGNREDCQRQKTIGTFDNARNLNAVKKNLAKFEFIDTENEQISSAQQLVERFLQNSSAGTSDVSQKIFKDSPKKKVTNGKQRYPEGVSNVLNANVDPSKILNLLKGSSQPVQQQNTPQKQEEQSFSFLFQQLNHLTKQQQQQNQQKYTNHSEHSNIDLLQGQYPFQKNQISSSKQKNQDNSFEFNNPQISPMKQQQLKIENAYLPEPKWDSKVTYAQPHTPQYNMEQQYSGINAMQPQFFHTNTSSHKKTPCYTEQDQQLNPTQCHYSNIHQSNNNKTLFDIPLDNNNRSNNHNNMNSSPLKQLEKTYSQQNQRLTQNYLTDNYIQNNIQQYPNSNNIYMNINSNTNKNRSLSSSRRTPYHMNEQKNIEALKFQQRLLQQQQYSSSNQKNNMNQNSISSFGNSKAGSSSKSSSATIYQSTRTCSQHDGCINGFDNQKKQLFYSSNNASKNANSQNKGQIYKNYYQGSTNSANKTNCNYTNNTIITNSNTQSSTFNLNFEQKDTSQTFNFADDKDQSKFDQADSSNVSCNLLNYENKNGSSFTTPIKQSNNSDWCQQKQQQQQQQQQSHGKIDLNYRSFALAAADSPKFVDPQQVQRSNNLQATEYTKQPLQILLLDHNQNNLSQPSQIASNPIITPSHADILRDQSNIFVNPHFFQGNRVSQLNEQKQIGHTRNDNTFNNDRNSSPFRCQDNGLKQNNNIQSERNKRNLSASPLNSAKKNSNISLNEGNPDCGNINNTEGKQIGRRFEQVNTNGIEVRNNPRLPVDLQEHNEGQGCNIFKANKSINKQANDNIMKIPDTLNKSSSNNLKTLGVSTPSKMLQQTQIVPSDNQQDQDKTLEKNAHCSAKPTVPAVGTQSKRSSSTKKEPQALEFHKSLEKFLIGKVLGFGSYAVVRLVQDKNTKDKYALKTYDKLKLADPQKRKNVAREVKILSKIKHPNIIRLYDVIETDVQLHLLMEFPCSTPLNVFIKTLQNRRFTEDEARPIFQQLVEAVKYCHRKQVVHRDIKLENILYDAATQKVKLIDFGFSIALAEGSKLNIFCGTPSYMAPEIVNKRDYSFQVDTWALGVLLFKILEGVFPFRGSDDKELFRKINSCKLEFQCNISQQARNMLSNILKHNQYERYTPEQILKDDWFKMGQDN